MTDRGSRPIFHDEERMADVSSIVGAIAHDFNNLLTPLLAYPQLIMDDLPEGTNGRALLEVMEKTAKDMVHITQQLLDFSSKDGMGQSQKVDINDIILDVLSQLKTNETISTNILIETVLNPNITPVKGVVDLLTRVLHNICINAVEAVGGKGHIKVQTENVHVGTGTSAAGMFHGEGDYIQISVFDDGPGIPDSIRNQIFNPFFTTKKGSHKRGAGLGLSVAYRIVKNHSGFIDFESKPDQGTTFSVYLPIAGESQTSEDIKSANINNVIEHIPDLLKCNSDRILVVDDEKAISRLFQMILTSALEGRIIDVASNGEEAVNAFVEKHHAVIVLDLHMPVMDGKEAFFKIESLCKENNWQMPSVVFCTGYAPSDSIKNVVEFVSKHCLLAKPVTGETIVEAVKGRLAK
jgi:nitrogen-specific signal transduction histidine kinase/ActR/RegA family two-component response regulator